MPALSWSPTSNYFLNDPLSFYADSLKREGECPSTDEIIRGAGTAGCQQACVGLPIVCYLEESNRLQSFAVMLPAGQAGTHKLSINKR